MFIKMKYQFELQKNIFMYNHLLICTDGQNKYKAICESAPTKEETILFWLDDFGFSAEDKEIFINELKEWSKSQGFHCVINKGKGR